MHSPPAWSMGKSQRNTWKGSGQPGPGSYAPQPQHKPRTLGGKIGTASRDGKRRNSVPGPGQYGSPVKVTTKSPEYSIAKKYPSNLKSNSPGPGAYEGTGQRGYDQVAPSYSFRAKPVESGKQKGPGPGAYEVDSRVQNLASPSFKMGSSQRDDLYNNVATPGPGTYSTRPTSASGPKFGFGSSERDPLYGMSKTLPGPGAYDFKGFAEEDPGKGTTLVPRRTERPETAKVPGPGAYDPTLAAKNSAPAYRMGSAQRGSSAGRSAAPGPGNYDPRPVKGSPNVKIGTSVRQPLSETVRTPGPGSYEYATKVGEGPRFSMKPRRLDKDDQFAPGPGAYEATSRIRNTKSPSYKMGSSTRDNFYKSSDAPGPGSYTTRPNSAFNKDSGPKHGFGTSGRDELNAMSKTLPGPGQYDFRSDFDGDRGTTLVPRRPDRTASATSPGPGAYNPNLSTKGQAPAYKMGSAARDSARGRSGTPGPGNYDPRSTKGSQTVRIGTSTRQPLSETVRTPGPGSYEYSSKVGEGPRFSMKPRRSERGNESMPGPGAYDSTSRIQNIASPSFKIGTASRDDLYNTGNTPGPGAYGKRPTSATGPKFGFGTSERDPLYGMSKTLPGPGSYEHGTMFDGDEKGKGMSMVSRRPDSALTQASKSPGPGAYEPSLSNKNQAPAYRIGSAPQRDSPSKNGAPGPGNYEPKLWQGGQNIRIGTSVRSPLSASGKNPGPGTYEAGARVGEGPRFTMNPRREDRHDRFAPGPGAYEATSRIQNVASPSYKIGTSSRDDLYRTGNAPGPGAYTNRPDSAGPKYGFGSSERDPLYGMAKTLPGPGSYEMRGVFEEEGRGTTLVPRREDQNYKSSSKSPGPGAYNPSLYTRDQAPAYKMGSAQRDSPTKGGPPGPGNYDPRLMQGGQNIRIGTSVRSPLSMTGPNPGPGTYDSGSRVGEGPRFTMNPRRDEKSDRFGPGPGAYEATSRIQNVASPSYKIGSSSRDDLYRTGNAPGPGAYTTRPVSAFNKESGPKHVFGTSERDPLHGMSKTLPGPGAYEHGTMFDGDSRGNKGMSMVPRRPESSTVKAPGPGAYNPNLYTKDQAPAYRMGSAPRDSPTKAGAPGPGNYEPRHVQGGQNIKIGTSVRSPLHGNEKTPGPGTYESPTKVGKGGAGYSMVPRREEKGDPFVPGPGAYTPSVHYVKDNNPAPKMGTSSREDLYNTRNNPGPGQYDTRREAGVGGPKWGFGSEIRSPNPKVEGPGPGAYEHRTHIGDVPKYAYGNAPMKISL